MRPATGTEPAEAAPIRSRLGRRPWLLVGLALALIAGLTAFYKISVLPPALERQSAEFAVASTQVLVDFPQKPYLVDIHRPLAPLAERASVLARLAPSPAAVSLIAAKAGLDPSQITAVGPYKPGAERTEREPSAERRAAQLSVEGVRYRLRFDSETDSGIPIVMIVAQAPTVEAAERLANASATGLIEYVGSLQPNPRVDNGERVVLREVGKPSGSVVNPATDVQIAAVRFLAALFVWAALVLAIDRLAPPRGWSPGRIRVPSGKSVRQTWA